MLMLSPITPISEKRYKFNYNEFILRPLRKMALYNLILCFEQKISITKKIAPLKDAI